MRANPKPLMALFLLFNLSAFGQFRMGFTFGLGGSNISRTEGGTPYTYSTKLSPQLGLVADIPLNGYLDLMPDLYVVVKGAFQNPNSYSLATGVNRYYGYFELPVNLVAVQRGKLGMIFGGLGPVFSRAYWDYEGGQKYPIGNDPAVNKLKPGDFGLNFTAGLVARSGLMIALNYSLGLSNVQPGGNSKNFIRNRAFFLSLGYLFGRSKSPQAKGK